MASKTESFQEKFDKEMTRREAHRQSILINLEDFQPKEMISYLDRYVYSQVEAKRALALAFQNMYFRIPEELDESFDHNTYSPTKTNTLLIGPTGCGKTLLVDTLTNMLNIPVGKIKLTGISAAGYIGRSIEPVFNQIITFHTKKGEKGEELRYVTDSEPFAVIYLDEIDKITGQQFFNGRLQNELVGYIEETKVTSNDISTKNILFIASGAFVGLEKIIAKRLNQNPIGFSPHVTIKDIPEGELLQFVTDEDLIEYGLIPELVGRFSNIASVKPLAANDILEISKMPTSELNRLLVSAEYNLNQTIKITPQARKEFAKIVAKKQTGARAIKQLANKLLQPELLDGTIDEDKTVTIKKQDIIERLANV